MVGCLRGNDESPRVAHISASETLGRVDDQGVGLSLQCPIVGVVEVEVNETLEVCR